MQAVSSGARRHTKIQLADERQSGIKNAACHFIPAPLSRKLSANTFPLAAEAEKGF